jgi:hypothetical protein
MLRDSFSIPSDSPDLLHNLRAALNFHTRPDDLWRRGQWNFGCPDFTCTEFTRKATPPPCLCCFTCFWSNTETAVKRIEAKLGAVLAKLERTP